MAFTLIFLFSFLLLLCFTSPEPLTGFLSLSCGSSNSFIDSFNLSWVSDSAYINVGRVVPSIPLRFFDEPHPARNCYRIAVGNLSLALIRASFVYNNYDGKRRSPAFFVSLGTAMSAAVNLSQADPWVEEFVWKVVGETLPFCLISIHGEGFPVISSLEVRPLPDRAYGAGAEELRGSLLRKRYRINCGCQDKGSLRYPVDYYDRIWDEDQKFHPSRLSGAFYMPLAFDFLELEENPPLAVLQTARVLARRNVLSYRFPLKKLGDYNLVIYFAGVLPVSSSFHVRLAEVSCVVYLAKSVDRIKVSFRNVSFYPLVNGIEIYEVVNIPPECPTTTVSALQVIQQSTGLDLGWEDDHMEAY